MIYILMNINNFFVDGNHAKKKMDKTLFFPRGNLYRRKPYYVAFSFRADFFSFQERSPF